MQNRWIILLLGACLWTGTTLAQAAPATPTGKVVLFLPLQLDSIFDQQSNYRYKKNEFPRFASGPLEFYQGFVDALDSLKIHPGNIDLQVIDIRSYDATTLMQLTEEDSIHQVQAWLLYGNANENRQLADAAKKYQLPLININLPNDAGIQDNPFYFMCNPTLQAQCEGIYRHLQQFYALKQIVIVRKKGGLDDRILNIWEEYGRITRGVPLKYKTIEVADSFNLTVLQNKLDSNKETLLFGASLDERFARNLAEAAAELHTSGYPIELMGMSTWENVREFSTNKYRELEIIIPMPYYFPRSDVWTKLLQTRYQENYFGKASDLYLRGYELAWFLHPELSKSSKNVAELLPGKKKFIFSEMNWQPVLDRQSSTLEYFENKKMYFLKRVDGNIRSVH